MAETYSAGIVTAYGAAVRGGYTGTYEEFCAEQASFAENAEQVAQDRDAMEALAAQFSDSTVPAAVQAVQDAGTTQIKAVEASSETEQQKIREAGTAQEARVIQAGDSELADIQAAGTTQVGNVNTAGTTQVNAVQAKGQEVIDSIPEDYTDLQNEVGDLKSAINSKANAAIRTVSGEMAVPVYADKAQENAVKSLVLSGAATSGCNKMIILDGSSDENWSKGSANEYGLVNYGWYFGGTLGLVKNNFGYSSHLKNAGSASMANTPQECFAIYGGGSNIGLRLKETRIGSVAELRSYLAANPIIVWCQTNTGYDATAPQYYVAQIENPDFDYKCVGTTELINPLATGDTLDFITGQLIQNGAVSKVQISAGLESGVGNACIAVPEGSLSVEYAMSADAVANQNEITAEDGQSLLRDITKYKTITGVLTQQGKYALPAVFEATRTTGYFKCQNGDTITIKATAINASAYYYRICYVDASYNLVGIVSRGHSDSAEINETFTAYGGCSYAAICWGSNYFAKFSASFSKNFEERINLLETNFEANDIVRSIAHRGGAYVVPENTLDSFKWARKQGYKYAETDVRFTSDNVAVLLHDASINRTARNADGSEISGTVNIADITYAQALEYDFGIYKGAEYAGQTIPTLGEFLALCRNIGIYPYVELKIGTEAQIRSIVDAVCNNGLETQVTFSSSSATLLTYAKNHNENVRLLYAPAVGITATTIEEAQAMMTGKNEVVMGASYNTLTTTMVELLQQAHIPLDGVYDINTQRIRDTSSYASGFVVENGLNAGNILYKYGMS